MRRTYALIALTCIFTACELPTEPLQPCNEICMDWVQENLTQCGNDFECDDVPPQTNFDGCHTQRAACFEGGYLDGIVCDSSCGTEFEGSAELWRDIRRCVDTSPPADVGSCYEG